MGRNDRRVWSRPFAGALVTIALVALFAVPVAAAPQVGTGPATLVGTVRDEGNLAPIDGAYVCLFDTIDLSSGLCSTTGASGQYSFGDLPEGDYTLRAMPPVGSLYLPVGMSLDGGYTPYPPIDVNLVAGTQTRDTLLVLGGALEITVTAPDGVTPAVNEPISLCRTDAPGEPGSCPQLIPLGGTDAAGQVTTTALVPGDYQVQAGAANSPYGYPTEVANVLVEPNSVNGVPLRMIAGGSLDGYVRDGNGTGIQGATVSLNPVSGFGTRTATSGPGGYYSFASLRPDTYSGTVSPPPGGPYGSTATGAIIVAEFDDLGADFTLPAATVITGTAQTDGSFAANVGAYIVCAGSATPIATSPPACSDGSVAVFDTVPVSTSPVPFSYHVPSGGTYTIRAAYYTGSFPNFTGVGSSPPVTLIVAAGATVTCTLVAGTPGSASCGGPPPPPPGTVVLTVNEPPVSAPLAGYYPGFCADPGVPMLLSTLCSDGRPAVIEFGVQGGTSRTVSLAPGTYNAAMGDPQLGGISPIGTVTVVSATTTFCTFTLAAGPECSVDDGDGIQEPPAGFPPDYSGNGDTIPDADQPNVTSLLPAVGSQPVTIAAPDGTTLSGVTTEPVPASPTPPGGVTFPVGLLGFSVHLADGDTAADVEIHLPAGTGPTGYYKLVGGAWVQVPATIVGDVVTLHLVDNDAFDTDPTVGVIGDPGGPVVDVYEFRGFVSPVVGKVAKAGSTVPVKWRITNGAGVALTDRDSFVGLTVAPCAGGSPTPIVSPGASGLQLLDDGTWQLNWKTAKAMAGSCQTLTLELSGALAGGSVDVRLK